MPETILDIPTAGGELLSSATAFADAAEQPGASRQCPVALALIEQGLRVLSASVGVLAHDAVPDGAERDAPARERGPTLRGSPLSREQEAHFQATLHALAQDIALTARSCARAREIVGPLLAARR